jgi:beta propeller repeat protein
VAASRWNSVSFFQDVAYRDLSTGSLSLVSGAGNQTMVDIDEGRFAYVSDTPQQDVWIREIGGTFFPIRLTNDAAAQEWPVIDGTRVLWQDERNGVTDQALYMYDFTTGQETQVYDDTSVGSTVDAPFDIDEDYVVHNRYQGFPRVIYQDLLDPSLLPQGVGGAFHWQWGPAIHGDRIVWADYRSGSQYDIYMYEISSETVTQLTDDIYDQETPDIHGDLVVWQDDRNGNWDIYGMDLRTGITQPIATSAFDEMYPSVYGHRVAWDSNSPLGGAYVAIGPTEVERLAGSDRYTTAVEISREHFAASHVAVLATGEDFPDALAASSLAGIYRAPLLLTRRTFLPSEVAAELTRLGVSDVVVTGGEAAVSSAVLSQINAMGIDTERVAGANRYGTAAEIAELVATEMASNGAEFLKKVFIARGDGFADALAVSPMAYRMHIPVLLVRPGVMPDETRATLQALDIEDAYIAGGTAAVGTSVQADLDARLAANGGVASKRWSGINRYETAEQVVRAGLALRWADLDVLGIATGASFPDALGGGAGCGSLGGALLLTPKDSLPAEVTAFLAEYEHDVAHAEILGGTAAVSGGVDNQIEALLP